MTPEHWQKIDNLFHAVLECPSHNRAEFLEQACEGDEFLRQEVESLIESHEQSDSFIEKSAGDVAAELFTNAQKQLSPGQLIGHYTISALLGAGGMGEVYLAEDLKLGRQVALKLLPLEFTTHPDRVRRFELEARAASALNHPNIVTIYEIGQSESSHFIANEFIDGQTLRRYMAEVAGDVRMDIGHVLDIAIQIASALAAAHSAGIVHRDIKPENIMLRRDGFVKVLDFGLAKPVAEEERFLGSNEGSARENQTAQGLILGTVNYMSPEQARGEEVDERTDIFSLGAVLYEMIAGRPPFRAGSASETLANLRHKEPVQLDQFAANVPDELQDIVSKGLCRDRDERYQTMRELLADLRTLKENLAFGEKLERLPPFQNRDATRRFGAANTDNNITAATQNSFSRTIKSQKPLAILAVAALLICVTSVGYYFLFARKSAVSAGGKKSIAVLPLKPINAVKRDEIYEFGIADSLIHRLSLTKGFIVRPLSATRKYADIEQDPVAAGQEQRVDYVIASNYQLADGKIRVTAQLFNVASGQIEETKIIEKDASNIFTTQDAIAGEVGKLLQMRFATDQGPAVKRGTNNEEAYRLYLQGKNLTGKRNQTDARKAIEYFGQAIRLDPDYALAYAWIAHAYHSVASGGGQPVENEKAKEAVKKALELDGNLAEAYAARGKLYLSFEYDFPAAEKDFLRAIELEPNNDSAHWGYALLLAYRGRFDEALEEMETAQAIDPGALMYMRDRGRILYYARRYDEAIVQFKRVIDLDENMGSGWLRFAYAMKGDEAQAYQIFIKNQRRLSPDRVEVYQKIYETAGWRGVQRKIFEFSKQDKQKPGKSLTGYYGMAIISAHLGEKDQAFEYLNRAAREREWWIVMLNVDPPLDPLRNDPRFAELVRRVGLHR